MRLASQSLAGVSAASPSRWHSNSGASRAPPTSATRPFRSARKAIENSVDAEKRKRRERSDSLDEVLKDHPSIVDPYTGEVSGNLVPSEDVLQHHNRLSAAKELVGMGTVSSNLKQSAGKSPKHNTAIALTNTAKALEGTLKMVCVVSMDIFYVLVDTLSSF